MKMPMMALALAAGLVAGAACRSQPAAAAPRLNASPVVPTQVLDTEIRRSIVAEVAKLMTDDYVLPDVGRRAAAAITQSLAAGDYDAITDPGALAQRLTEDLHAVTRDKHLRVRGDAPPRGPTEPAAKPPRSERGFTRVAVLRGNIGYVDLNGFVGKSLFKPVADKVMQQLAETDALILDLRSNGGGNPSAVTYWVSFFVDPGAPVHVNDLLWRKPGTGEYRRDVFQTEATPVSYLGKPVLILIGPRTFSGGEEFAYDMQSLKRAVLVGEVTGGGANPGRPRPLQAGLSIFVPTGQAVNPITRTNWEGRGVQPDLPSAPDQAFATAYEAARKAAGKKPLASGEPSGPETVMERLLLIPRLTAQPGSEAALRRSVAELQAGAPRYELLSPELAELTRAQLPQLHADVAALGPLQSVRFVEIGRLGESVYDLKFAKEEWRWSILLDDDGKIIMASFRPK